MDITSGPTIFPKISDGDGDSVDLNQKKMKKNTSPLVLDTRTADIATGSESCAVLWDFRLADFRTIVESLTQPLHKLPES